jgi:sugar lactone lactonase YvrE
MNSLRFKSNSRHSSLHSNRNSSGRRLRRGLFLTVTVACLLVTGALVWNQGAQAAPETAGAGLTGMVSRAGLKLRAAISASFAPVQSAQDYSISTVAGGAFRMDIPGRQAPVVKPFLAARDPLGRGYYIVDDALLGGFIRANLVRFYNSSSQPVTLAGSTINPGNLGLIAGGGDQLNIVDNALARETTLELVSGLAVSPDGAVICLTTSTPAIFAINVSAQDVTLANATVSPGRVKVLFSSSDFNLGRDGEIRGLAVNFATQTFYYTSKINVSAPNPTPGLRGLVFSIDSTRAATLVGGDRDGDGTNTGDGSATSVNLAPILSIALNPNNGDLLLGEGKGGRDNPGLTVRRISGGFMTRLADAHFPCGLAVSPNGTIYVADGTQVVDSSTRVGNQISRVSGGSLIPVAGRSGQYCTDLTTGCGDGGNALDAQLTLPDNADAPFQIAADDGGVVIPGFFVAGDVNKDFNKVRYANTGNATVIFPGGLSIGPGKIDFIMGNGLQPPYDTVQANYATLSEPSGVAADAQGNLFIGDYSNGKLRFVNRTQQPVTLFANTSFAKTAQPGTIVSARSDVAGIQEIATTSNGVFMAFPDTTGLKCTPTSAPRSGLIHFLNTSSSPVTLGGVTINPGESQRVVGITGQSRACSFGEGDGGSANAALIFPADIVTDSTGSLYIAEVYSNRVRKIDAGSWVINTLTIQDGGGSPLTLNGPAALAISPSGQLLIADTKNNRVLRQNAAGSNNYTVIADSAKGINRPRGLATDSSGNVFVLNAGTHQVIQIRAIDNAASVVAGTVAAGYSGDGGPASLAQINLTRALVSGVNDPVTLQQAFGITRLPGDEMAFADVGNNAIRLLGRAQNFPPVLAAISDQAMNEGATLTLQFTATDQNPGDQLHYRITNRPAFGTFTDNGNGTASLQLAPQFTDAGVYDITLTVFDGAEGESRTLSDSKTFRLTVNDFNRPPTVSADTIASPIIASTISGVSVNLVGTVNDPDGEAVTWKWFDGATQIASGSGNIANATVTLLLGQHSIFLEGADSRGAKSTTPIQTVVVRDNAPPVIGDIPANQTFEGDTLGGKVFTFTNPTVTDNIDPNPQLQVTGVPANNLYPVGTTTVTFIATDAGGNQATKSFTVTVTDTTRPTISGVPSNQTFEGDTLGGKVFTFQTPTANDIVSGAVIVVVTGAPANNLYPVGTTTVNFSATDGAGNQATASFTVTVTDTTRPTINGVPGDTTVEATSAQGAVVNYTLPTATDIVSGNVAVTTSHASGSTFPIGVTTVNFSAQDQAGNASTASFNVTVRDTTAPVLSNLPTPNPMIVAASSAQGANVNFNLPTATDVVDGVVTVTASPPSGSLFPVGDTTVTFTATDSRNNTATATLLITVVAVPPPTISNVPADVTVEATSAAGAVVNYTPPTAVSGQGAPLPVVASPPGNQFPLGTTMVTFTATDNLGLSSTASFKVTVVDTTAPTIIGDTPDLTTEALSLAGAVVNYNLPTATDLVDGPVTVNTTHPSGSTFPIGITTVTLTAKDARNNTATRTFTVNVLANISYNISTFAGLGRYGSAGDGGPATEAEFKQIVAVARDPQGRLLILDAGNRNLRRVEEDGTIRTIAGNTTSGNTGDGGQAISARFGTPSGMAVDSNGNIYISDLTYNRIRVVLPNGTINHFAGNAQGDAGFTGEQGAASSAKLRQPKGLAVDASNNLYIADSGNHRIRKVDATSRIITTVAGNSVAGYSGDGAPATTLSLNLPAGVAVDAQGNIIIADTFNHRIRRVDGATQIMTTLTGNGSPGFGGDDAAANLAQINNPMGVGVDGRGNVFIADTNNNRIRRISKATGKIRTVAGTGANGFGGDGGPAEQAMITAPAAVAPDETGNTVYVADTANMRVRRLDAIGTPPPPANTSPTIGAISNQTLNTGQVVDVALTASDAENDPVSFSLSNAPAFVTLTNVNQAQRTATLRIAPGQNDGGTFNNIIVQVSDGRGGAGQSAPFSITVNGAGNRAPQAVIAGGASVAFDATSADGAVVTLNGTQSSDPDGDALSFLWTEGAAVLGNTATISPQLSVGVHTITLTVNDGRGGTGSTTQTVTIREFVQQPLSVLQIDPTAGRQGQTLDVTLTGTGFQPGARVKFSGDGITATVTAVTSSQLIMRVVIASNAPVGSSLSSRRNVTVTNPDGITSTLTRIFAVFPK